MRIVDQIVALFRALFRSARVDADLSEEMRFHVERETDANIARGMSPAAARRAAHLIFGSVDASHEQSRDDRPGAGVRQLGRDIRFGARLLKRTPVFTFTGIAIVALGIGAATAIFSVVYGVMLRPLPYREPERLVSIWLQRGTGHTYPSAADAAELRQLRSVFTDVALIRSSTNLNLVGDGEPRRLLGARVSPNLFSLLGVSPTMGRTFTPDEDQPGHERVALLSDALWRGRFGADPAIVGRQIHLNGSMHTVIGVMPPEFQYPVTNLEAWVPAVLEPGELTREGINNYRVVARLDPRMTPEQARREVSALAKRLGNTYQWNKGAGFTLDSMLDDAVRDVRPALSLLLGAVSFLLLIACVNLSNLFGARASARSGEFAVRLALGASRNRLIAQAIAEAAPVLVLGGVLGVAVAQWAVHAFVAAAPEGLPRIESIAMSAPVLVFSLAVLILTGIAASVMPAIQAGRSDFTTITKDGGRSSTSGRGRSAARRVGIAVQIAFALPLLVGASLLIQSAIQVTHVDAGFRPDHVATWAFEVSRTKHESDQQVSEYYARVIEAVRAVPGVTKAAIVNRIPLVGAQTNPVRFENPTGTNEEVTDVDSRTVTPDYFAAMGITLVAGRTFTEHDDVSSPEVGIVDERVARTIWPGQTVIGKRFRGPDDKWATVVGVVAHVRTAGLEVDPRPQVYWSYRQWAQNRAVLAVRTETEPRALVAPVIKAIRSVDAEQSVFDVHTMTEIVDRSLAQRRLTTLLMAGFSGAALLLAAVGIYGVVAYGVTQRLREFGIRIALGATRREVTRLVVWQGTSMAVAGAVIGVVLAVAAAGIMSNLVFGVAPRDAVSLLGTTALLMFVAAAASYIPARRAAMVDPGVTLRAE
ncbi:MAG TPA: ABC transporter permease [Gemmatimonadaceae bacterium]|nr:ABC transporter permease [Gemmatimonadaceae bacterium]